MSHIIRLFFCIPVIIAVVNGDELQKRRGPTSSKSLQFEEKEIICPFCSRQQLYGLSLSSPERFPETTQWYVATVTTSRIIRNSPSIVDANDYAWFEIWPVGVDREKTVPRTLKLKYDAYAFEYELNMWGYIGLTKSDQLFEMYFPACEVSKPKGQPQDKPSDHQTAGKRNSTAPLQFSYKNAVCKYGKCGDKKGYGPFPTQTTWHYVNVEDVVTSQNTAGKPESTVKGRMWRIGVDVKQQPGQTFELRDFDQWTEKDEMVQAGEWGYIGTTPSGELFNAHFPAPSPDADKVKNN